MVLPSLGTLIATLRLATWGGIQLTTINTRLLRAYALTVTLSLTL
jgi:hypothetical protein